MITRACESVEKQEPSSPANGSVNRYNSQSSIVKSNEAEDGHTTNYEIPLLGRNPGGTLTLSCKEAQEFGRAKDRKSERLEAT